MASFEEVVKAWRDSSTFRLFFNTLLSDCPFAAFRWESPPVSEATRGRPFEFVLIESPELDRPANRRAFDKHFAAGTEGVAAFPNLGGDAILVVPKPVDPDRDYPHLGMFVRGAPEWQVHAVWAKLGEVASQRIGRDPVWISTAGAGVAWLHIRLDKRPKYYVHRPYRSLA